MAKRSKALVLYQGHPNNGRHCSQCRHFLPPDACEGVAGEISPNGWCVRYSIRPRRRGEGPMARNWYGRGGGRGGGGRGGGERARPSTIHERHAQERADTHARHRSARDTQHKQHQQELDALNQRHDDELAAAQDQGQGAGMDQTAATPPAAAPGSTAATSGMTTATPGAAPAQG